ncbi:hypothetical protein PIB30_051994 [Stylosanthes scabra]|uniref:Putative plant transposon protein domain-containing protein n=1 Tax=Stylosanthes scabra TaxID=79078 RepID=A0ABU6TIY8_9FABA|nr:hypothetical protein [Stylosanthes scabra]
MTMVRGVDISFAPDTIRKVLKTRERPLPNVASYHDRKNENLRLEEVQEYLCEEGGEWVRHANGRPHYLKRNDLTDMARGWYDFVCKSIMPTTNRSELTVDRAVLIHSIMIGEDIRVEEIIADQIYKFVNKKNIRSKLAFPSIIALLCREAKVKVPPETRLFPKNWALMQRPWPELESQDSQESQDNKGQQPHNNHHSSNCNPKFIEGLINNKKRVGRVSKPSTQGWIAWMTN